MSEMRRAVRVALPCSGLGRQRRGFETFTREVAQALRGDSRLQVTLYGGGGEVAPGERAVPNLPRTSKAARVVGAVTRRGAYFVEQASFFAAFLPHLVMSRPDIIYFADLNFGNACWHWRRLTGQRFRLLYYNGGATTMPYTRCDLVQQVSPEHLDAALARGEAAERMVLLPHGMAIPPLLPPRDVAACAAIRRELGVGPGRSMLLSVGMLDATVKRMDALVDAVALLGDARPHLVMLGERTGETPALIGRAREKLGEAVTVDTWPRARMAEVYAAADAFALLSRREGFGLAYLEALAAGLPCVAHDTATTRFILGEHGWLGDTVSLETTAALLRGALSAAGDETLRREGAGSARRRFSWEVLAPRYGEMLRACADGTRPQWDGP